MSLNGSISVNALFHDTDGTTSLKIVSLKSTEEYTTGKVAVLTGTAGTSAVSFSSLGATTYKDASGNAVSFSGVRRLLFSWSGTEERVLLDQADSVFLLRSKSSSISVSDCTNFLVEPRIEIGNGTGTYTIVLYGT